MHLCGSPARDTVYASLLGALLFAAFACRLFVSKDAGQLLFASYFVLLACRMASYVWAEDPHPLDDWGKLLVSQVWIAAPLASLCLWQSRSEYLLLCLFITVWINDTGAYIAGTLTARLPKGNHKMCPKVSPKKSWEGLAGGMVFSVLAAIVYIRLGWIEQPVAAFIFAGCVSVLATIGDLMESLVKRSLGVKDSGVFLPGHGGILDRFDSILLASPVMYIIMKVLEMIQIQ